MLTWGGEAKVIESRIMTREGGGEMGIGFGDGGEGFCLFRRVLLKKDSGH